MTKNNAQQAVQGISKTVLAVAVIVSLAVGFYIGYISSTVIQPQAKSAANTAPGSSMPPTATPGQQGSDKTAALEKVALDHPNEAVHWIDLGNHYFDTNKPFEAIEAYERALALEPDNANVLTDLGVMYRRSGQPQKAIQSFDRAVTVDPDHEIARFNKGIVLMHDMENTEAAIEVWKELLLINPMATAPNGAPLKDMIEQLQQSG